MSRKLFAILFAVLLLPGFVFAQSGKLSGKVVDRETGDALPGANVIIEGTSLGAATDVSGEYVILTVPTGVYSLRASFIGYKNVTVLNVRVNSGLTTQLEFELPSEALEVSEISIVAERPLVNKNATNAVRIQGYEDIKNMPLRGVTSAIALQPGVVIQNDQIYIRGGRENDVGFYLDGANVRDRDGGGARKFGADNPLSVIPEAIEEIQIQAGGYNAEFGGANAGIVQQTLKSGRPEYSVTLQYETDDFASRGDQFLSTNSFGYRDLVGTLSGPVPGTSDKLRFFVALETDHVDDRAQRFWQGYNFQHVPEAEFNALTEVEQNALISQGRFPLVTTTFDDPAILNLLATQGITTPDGNIAAAARDNKLLDATLTYDLKPFIIRLSGAFSNRQQNRLGALFGNQTGGIAARVFNLDRQQDEEVSTGLVNLKLTHLINDHTFYEINVNKFERRELRDDPVFGDNFWAYWDSTANKAKGIDFTSLNSPWEGGARLFDVYGFNFEAPGRPSTYSKSKRGYVGGSLDFTTQLPDHEVKAGVSFESWTARNFAVLPRTILQGSRNNPDVFRGAKNGVQEDVDNFRGTIAGSFNRSVYGYDSFGNELDGDGLEGAKHPKYFSAYLQDKFEASDLVINAGVRLDYIDNDDFEFADPANPPWNRANNTLFEDQLLDVDPHVEISPRLGLAFPVSDRTVFHMQYGKFVQAPRLTDIYNGSAWFDAIFTGGTSFQGGVVGLALKPEKTTQYEIGFSQQFSDNAAFDLTTFYKNVNDQIQFSRVIADPSSGASDYNVMVNGDFATTSGIEMSLRLRRTNRLSANLNYTFSRALGTGSLPSSSVAGIEIEQEVPTLIAPLDFHHPHTGSLNLDYRFGKGDGGSILEQLGANLLLTFQSGHPFTFSDGDFGQQDDGAGGVIGDPRFRRPEEAINSSFTPWNWSVDLRVDKTINFGSFDTNFYFYVQNLTNKKNVQNVYLRTGNAFNDGWLDNAGISASTIESNGGARYEALYRAFNLNGNGANYNALNGNNQNLLGTPRQIRVGARIQY